MCYLRCGNTHCVGTSGYMVQAFDERSQHPDNAYYYWRRAWPQFSNKAETATTMLALLVLHRQKVTENEKLFISQLFSYFLVVSLPKSQLATSLLPMTGSECSVLIVSHDLIFLSPPHSSVLNWAFWRWCDKLRLPTRTASQSSMTFRRQSLINYIWKLR